MSSLLNLLLLLLTQIVFLLADPILQLPSGLISGRQSITSSNKPFYSFYGIPYAFPPIGDLRFKPPQPTPEWADVRDTSNYFGRSCYQVSSNSDSESEDCLYLDVHTPQLPGEGSNVSLPVMIYIHGGGFVDGSGMGAPGDPFVNNDVLLVSINYRLGLFGFISTQDEIIPGNNGLKDQKFAIQWVHDNIHIFGGDPDQVTIFGQSAGSASCAYQLLNQENTGLFRAAILESGSFLSPWAFQRRAREIAFKTASFVDPTFENSTDAQALLDLFMTLGAETLDSAAEQYRLFEQGPQDQEILQGFYWAPVVEVKNPDAFLTRKMYGLLQAGNVVNVPLMMGTTSEEGIVFTLDPSGLLSTMQQYDQHLDWLVPNDMEIADQSTRTQMGNSIRNLYTGGEPLADHLGDGVRYLSDTSLTRSVIKHAELFSKLAETYFYIFSYDGPLGNVDVHYDGAESVGHSEELFYLFCGGEDCEANGFPESDKITRQRLIKLWTDFAKYQKPTPEASDLLQNLMWPALDTSGGDYYYLDIDADLQIMNHPKVATYEGWSSLYNSLEYNDFDTY